MTNGLRPLGSALDFRLSELLQLDFWAAVAGAAAGVTLGLEPPQLLWVRSRWQPGL